MQTARHRRSFLLGSGALGAALLAGCETSSAPAAPTAPAAPATPPTPPAAPPVAATGFPMIADTATRLDVTKARALKTHGVRTVFRYYSHLPPSLPGKDLQPEEATIILGEGLSLGVVFQHFNNCFRTFENRWGREDAEQALRMAEGIRQPAGSAVYFGVDGDWPWASMRDLVVAYFEDIKRAFEGSGLKVGVYSNGCLCNSVMEKGLAELAWLSGSTGHSGTQAFYNTGRWTMYQNVLDVTPVEVGVGVDGNLANPAAGGVFGQFNASGVAPAAHPSGDVTAMLAARRFLKAATDLKGAADGAGSTLVSLRKDSNVRVIEAAGDWTRVLTQEGAANRAGPAQTGWLPSAALAPMDRFPDGSATYGLCGSAATAPESARTASCERATSRLR